MQKTISELTILVRLVSNTNPFKHKETPYTVPLRETISNVFDEPKPN